MKRLSLVICALAVAVPVSAQDATGKWHLTVTTSEREPRTASMVLKKEGEKLSGTLIPPEGNEIAVSGTQTGSDVAFSFTATTQNGPIAVSMKGRQEAESMTGTLLAGAEAQGQWTATRAVNPTGSPSGTSDPQLTGAWALEVLTEAGTRTPTVVLKQEGGKLTGRYKSQLGEAAVTGKVTDQNFSFEVTLPIEGTAMTIAYTGTVGEAGLKGRATIGGTEVGAFTGKKAQSGAN